MTGSLSANALAAALATPTPAAGDSPQQLLAKILVANRTLIARYDQFAFVRPSNTTAYTANDVVGATGAGGAVLPFVIGVGAAENITINSALLIYGAAAVPSGMAGFRLHLYSAAPDNIADNAAYALSSAGDIAAYQGYISFDAPAVVGGVLTSQVTGINIPCAPLAATTLYGQLQTLGAFTPASAAAVTIDLYGTKLAAA
jgi:hypothetical protein